ncbi:MAG TPA: hypothetical protein VFG20_18085 [Planctomycetaceae bacterium]|jgi:hypothetical protein|nr:hypothetical protein [Planctomycetaceae bacterium]
MGTSSHSSRSKVTAFTRHWEQLRTWCGQRPYVVLGFGLSMVILGGAVIGNSFMTPVAVINDTEEEEFADLGLELDLPLDDARPSRSTLRVAAVTPVRPPSTAEFADLTTAFGTDHSPASGIVAATYEGLPSPSPEAPVWLAGTIETDDDLADFTFPSPAGQVLAPVTGPILSPQ